MENEKSMKSARGRPPKVKRDSWHIWVESDTALYFRMQNLDGLTGQVKYGSLSELVNRLLREEMNRQIRARGNRA